jgi:crotonobetainyl-CoA:carnitine CoA-transferase CaiB-like acyl-CoA transferase
LTTWQTRGLVPRRGGEVLSGGFACYQIYGTQDGKYVSLGALEGKFWSGFCHKIGRPEYITEHLVSSSQPEIKKELTRLFQTRTRDEWVNFFADDDICFSPVLEYNEAVQNEQLLDRQMLIEVQDGERQVTVMGVPVKLSDTPGRALSAAPAPGQHTAQLLQELGYSEPAIAHLRERKVIS